jgi:hypothetical protein
MEGQFSLLVSLGIPVSFALVLFSTLAYLTFDSFEDFFDALPPLFHSHYERLAREDGNQSSKSLPSPSDYCAHGCIHGAKPFPLRPGCPMSFEFLDESFSQVL